MIKDIVEIIDELNSINKCVTEKIGANKEDRINERFMIDYFYQTWPTTSLGFDRLDGNTSRTARTWIVKPNKEGFPIYVFFGGYFAYEADDTQEFWFDITRKNLKPVCDSDKYRFFRY